MRRTLASLLLASLTALAAQAAPVDNSKAPTVAADIDLEFLKLPPGMNFGEVLGVAVDSKGRVVVLNHPGSATTGPIYGAATTNLLEFDAAGNYVGEIGKGVYGMAYGHSVRFDRYDNLWYVDKATDSVVKFNPQGRVVMNLGRRPEGYDSFEHVDRPRPDEAKPVDGYFKGATDVGFDADDNIYVSDGYTNSRIAKFDKNGDWVKAWGQWGPGGDHADENPGNIRNPHNMQVARNGDVYVADRGNRRIQVFDKDGKFLRFLFLNAPYDKTVHPTLGNMPATRPDETAPWALCLTTTPTQYLYAVDSEPSRVYKMSLDGKILAMVGTRSGRGPDQLNWPHAIACPSENVVFVADMNNWRVKKITLHPDRVLPRR